MNERIVRWVIQVIPTVLLIGCIVAAFATNGWNVQATLFAEDPVETAKSLVDFNPDASGGGQEFFKVNDVSLSGDRVTVEIEIHSPINMPVTVEELSGDMPVGNGASTISLSEPVTIPAKGSANLNLEGALPDITAISDPHSLESQAIRNVSMTFDIAGIRLKVKQPDDVGGII